MFNLKWDIKYEPFEKYYKCIIEKLNNYLKNSNKKFIPRDRIIQDKSYDNYWKNLN